MAPRGNLHLSSGGVFVLLELIMCQLEAINASHRFGVAHGEHDHVDVANSNKSSDPVTWAPWSPGAIVANVTPAFLSPLCFGSDCSRQRQCDTLQGLTCASNENGTLKYACGPSTPVYLPAGGVHKCVAATRLFTECMLLNVAIKYLNETCVIDQNCNFRNPNVLCISSCFNCSRSFESTTAKLCLLPQCPFRIELAT